MTHRTTIALSMILAAACGGRSGDQETPPTALSAEGSPGGQSGAPRWVSGDCAAHLAAAGPRVLCGVGAVKGIQDPNLARTAAQGRGRTEIARTVQVGITAALTDYQAQGTDRQGILSAENAIESISKQVADVSLSGTRMVESWQAPDGTFYALMVLDEGGFRSTMETASHIDAPVRDVVISYAPKLFSSYDDAAGAY